MNASNTPKFPLFAALILALPIGFASPAALADTLEQPQDCAQAGAVYDQAIQNTQALINQSTDDTQTKTYEAQLASLNVSKTSAITSCTNSNNRITVNSANQKACAARGGDYRWDSSTKQCTNDVKDLTDSGECNSAALFSGALQGQNCKATADTVADVKARTSAITDSSTAITQAYSMMQATGATGQQTDAQTRQQQMLQTMATAKFITGGLGLASAAQLKSAASGAEQANTNINNAYTALQATCNSDANAAMDEQDCFYKNAAQYNIPADSNSYANFSRMKTGAQQSQDEADAANTLAKSSLVTGLADTFMGIQAMKMAQLAQQNANNMAPPMLPLVGPPPVSTVSLAGDAQSGPPPGAVPGQPMQGPGGPTTYAAPLGMMRHGPVGSGMVPGKAYPFDSSTPVKSSVSAAAGGGGGVGGGGLHSPPVAPRRATKGGSNTDEYNLGVGQLSKPAGTPEKNDGSNPFADVLAKLFPQDQNGKPVVDTRQLASEGLGISGTEPQADSGVEAADLSIFEQISSRYRQLAGTGNF